LLQQIQQQLYDRARALRETHTVRIDSKDDFYDFFTPKNKSRPEIHGGFALAHWSGSAEVEAKIKEELKVTIRCIPFDDFLGEKEPGICPFSGDPSPQRVVFAKSY
jgi:prolyl-tRNA synthetase